MDFLQLWVPKNESSILPGSAIVGNNEDQEKFTIYYEGNLHNSLNVITYENKIQVAASRYCEKYPTVAKKNVFTKDYEPVGLAKKLTSTIGNKHVFGGWIVLSIDNPKILQEWLGKEELPLLNGSMEIRNKLVSATWRLGTRREMIELQRSSEKTLKNIADVVYEKYFL